MLRKNNKKKKSPLCAKEFSLKPAVVMLNILTVADSFYTS